MDILSIYPAENDTVPLKISPDGYHPVWPASVRG